MSAYNKRITSLYQALINESVLLIRWDMKSPFHNDRTHEEHEKRDTLVYDSQDTITHCYALKDLCNKHFSAKVDLLLFHADEIEEKDKRADVLYHYIDFNIAKHKGKAKEWDRTAIKTSIEALNIKLNKPLVTPNLIQKLLTYFKIINK